MTSCCPPTKAPVGAKSVQKPQTAKKAKPLQLELSFNPRASIRIGAARLDKKRWNHIDTTQPLSKEVEIELVLAYQGGDRDAGGIVITAHQGLVYNLAKKQAHMGCPLEDLVAEANLGICEAMEKFDPTKGARLSTYAVWWIRQYLRKALTENSRIIRIPISQQNAVREIHATAARLMEDGGNYPSDEEIAAECDMSVLKVQNLRNLTVPMISLSAPVSSAAGDARTYEDILSDQTGAASSPLDTLTRKNNKESILSIIERRLNDKEKTVILNRFGLVGGRQQTLEEVGNLLNLTRERIRQIQEAALKKLKGSLLAEQTQQATLLSIPQFGE